MPLSKVLMYEGRNLEKPRILLLVPTGVAAKNNNDTAIHIGLGKNIRSKMYPLNDKQMSTLGSKLQEVQFLIIDEISMVSNVLFYQVHQRLNKIFGCESNVAFSGLPGLVCGDFYQLPTVRGLSIFANALSKKGYLNLDL